MTWCLAAVQIAACLELCVHQTGGGGVGGAVGRRCGGVGRLLRQQAQDCRTRGPLTDHHGPLYSSSCVCDTSAGPNARQL